MKRRNILPGTPDKFCWFFSLFFLRFSLSFLFVFYLSFYRFARPCKAKAECKFQMPVRASLLSLFLCFSFSLPFVGTYFEHVCVCVCVCVWCVQGCQSGWMLKKAGSLHSFLPCQRFDKNLRERERERERERGSS